MTEPLIQLACERLQLDEGALARKLEISSGCLRSWREKTPRYAQLALAALIAGLDVDLVRRLDDLRGSKDAGR
jgi:hypothetical protein